MCARFGIRVSITLACTLALMIATTHSSLANVWLAFPTGNELWKEGARANGIALAPDQRSLVVSWANRIARLEFAVRPVSSTEFSKYRNDSSLDVGTHGIGVLANNQIVTLTGSVIQLDGLYGPGLFYNLPHSDIDTNKTSFIGPINDTIWITPLSLAFNDSESIFVASMRRAAAQQDAKEKEEVSDQSTKYCVWELWRDAINRWHATPLAFGSVRPKLVSTRTNSIVLLEDPQNKYELSSEGKQKLDLQPFAPVFSNGAMPFDRNAMVGVAQEVDRSVVISESTNQRVWKLAFDGRSSVPLAGADTSRDKRQKNPLAFNLNAGPIATAPGGGFFVVDGSDIRFVGPNDTFEKRLASLVTEAEEFATTGAFEEAHARTAELQKLQQRTGMRGTRATIALTTLRDRLGQEGFNRVMAGLAPAVAGKTDSEKPRPLNQVRVAPEAKKEHCCHWFWHACFSGFLALGAEGDDDDL